MENLSELLTAKNRLQMPLETWQRYLALPGSSKDQFIAAENFSEPNGQWEVAEMLLAEAVNEGKPSDDYHMSVLLNGQENRYVELDFGAGKFRRPSRPGTIVFGTGGAIKGRGPFHSIGFHINKQHLHHRMAILLNREVKSLEMLQSNYFADEIIAALLQQLLNSFRAESAVLREDLIDRICHRLLIISHHKVTVIADEDRLKATAVRNVIEYMHANLHQDLSRDELAHIAGVSGPYFSRLFAQTVGQPPKQYLLKLRIQRACQLLSDGTQQSISSIGQMCGFSELAHFSTVFRRHVGLPPGEYRRLMQ